MERKRLLKQPDEDVRLKKRDEQKQGTSKIKYFERIHFF